MSDNRIQSERGSKEEFWQYFGERRSCAPNAAKLRKGFGGHTDEGNTVEVDGYVFTIYQYVANETVGVYMKANHKRNQTVAEFDERLKSYQELFEARLSKIRNRTKDKGSYLGSDWRWSSLLWVGSTYERKNWDEMADFLDDKRRAYEQILREGAGRS